MQSLLLCSTWIEFLLNQEQEVSGGGGGGGDF